MEVVLKVFIVTRFGKIVKNISSTISTIGNKCFNGVTNGGFSIGFSVVVEGSIEVSSGGLVTL